MPYKGTYVRKAFPYTQGIGSPLLRNVIFRKIQALLFAFFAPTRRRTFPGEQEELQQHFEWSNDEA